MKQRAIKRCIKRVQKKLMKGGFRHYKGRVLDITEGTRGIVFAPLDHCSVHVLPKGDVRYTNRDARVDSIGHQHWYGNRKAPVAVSYAK